MLSQNDVEVAVHRAVCVIPVAVQFEEVPADVGMWYVGYRERHGGTVGGTVARWVVRWVVRWVARWVVRHVSRGRPISASQRMLAHAWYPVPLRHDRQNCTNSVWARHIAERPMIAAAAPHHSTLENSNNPKTTNDGCTTINETPAVDHSAMSSTSSGALLLHSYCTRITRPA